MSNLILFCIATVGLTNILVHGKILDLIHVGKKSIREWMLSMGKFSEVWECYECTGFWSGLIIGLILFGFKWWVLVSCAFAGSVLSQFYSEFIYLIRSKTEFVISDDTENMNTTNESDNSNEENLETGESQ